MYKLFFYSENLFLTLNEPAYLKHFQSLIAEAAETAKYLPKYHLHTL